MQGFSYTHIRAKHFSPFPFSIHRSNITIHPIFSAIHLKNAFHEINTFYHCHQLQQTKKNNKTMYTEQNIEMPSHAIPEGFSLPIYFGQKVGENLNLFDSYGNDEFSLEKAKKYFADNVESLYKEFCEKSKERALALFGDRASELGFSAIISIADRILFQITEKIVFESKF